MKFTRENCLGDDYEKVFDICFENLFDLFSDPLSPTQEECTMFTFEYGVEYIIKPEQRECNTSE